jgi:hypothetical protein
VYQKVLERLNLLVQIPLLPGDETPTISQAQGGSYSLFYTLSRWEQRKEKDAVEKITQIFPQHAALDEVRSVHLCYEMARVWEEKNLEENQPTANNSNNKKHQKKKNNNNNNNNNNNDEEGDEEHGDEDEFVLSSSQQSQLLLSTSVRFNQSCFAAFHVWTHHLAPLFWKCSSLVELARKTPSENMMMKLLKLDLSEFRTFISICRDCLNKLHENWGSSKTSALDAASSLPFPSHFDGVFVQSTQDWTARSSEQKSEIHVCHLMCRMILTVVKYKLRSVVVSCVLPLDSQLRDKLKTEDGGAEKSHQPSKLNNPEFQRREFVLKLFQKNNKLAIAYAKMLNVDLEAVRKMARRNAGNLA